MVPRVFVSSTFYDLRFVREDISNFIKTYNFEPILFEYGDVGFTPGEVLDASCYKEMRTSDMAILVIGGRYGSPASGEDSFSDYLSITRKEFNTAVEEHIPIYAFVDKSVLGEYYFFIKNKVFIENAKSPLTFTSVDNINIFYFIETIFSLQYITVTAFSEMQDIKNFLKKQWADMFKAYLTQLRGAKKDKVLLDSIHQMETLLSEMNIMLQKTGEKIIGENESEWQVTLKEQQIESVVNIILNSITVLSSRQKLEDIRSNISTIVVNLTKGTQDGILMRLLSKNEKDVKEVYNFVENGTKNLLIASLDEKLAISLNPYKALLEDVDVQSAIIERLMPENHLGRIGFFVLYND